MAAYDLEFDLLTLDEYAEEVRLNLSEQAEKLGCRHLSNACLSSLSPTDVYESAWFDLVKMNHTDLLNAALGAGAIVGEMNRLIRSVGRLAMAQEVDGEQ